MWRNTIAKQKLCGETLQQFTVFFFLNTKQNSQPAQYEKNKIDKDLFGKKKIHKKKKRKSCMVPCNNL